MNKVNRKGFTLIELLAVIVIMGILMIIAIPLMTRYIENSRRDTFIQTAKTLVQAARYQYLGGEMSCSGSTGVHVIPMSQIMIERTGAGGTVRSSFGNQTITAGWVMINTTADGVSTYAINLVDSGGNGFSTVTVESGLTNALRNTGFSNTLSANGAPRPSTFPGGGTAPATNCCLAGQTC